MPAPILGFNRETHSRVLSQRVVHVPGFYWTYGIDAHHSAISYRYAARNENSVLVVPASSMDSKGYQGRSPWLIGIGGSLAAPPLPHHRTYGSVYGGSAD